MGQPWRRRHPRGLGSAPHLERDGKAPGTWIECSSLLRCDRAWSSSSVRAASSGFSCLRWPPRITQPVAVAWMTGPLLQVQLNRRALSPDRGHWRRDRHRRTWTDDKCGPLEDHLYSFVRSLLIAANVRTTSVTIR